MKRKIRVEIDWTFPWIIGWFFTLGYTGLLLNIPTWYEQILVSIVSFILWPFLLGISMSGRIIF